MERIVIAVYKLLKGKEAALKELTIRHWQVLNTENLVSNRKPIIMESEDGTIVEVFGWKSKESIDAAHTNPVISKMWENFAEVCEHVPIANVSESTNLFSEFTPLN